MYSEIGIPCIVEHAGLIFEEYEHQSYPGGLTKPMWNALGDGFLKETQSAGRRAIARAVVGYCNGRERFGRLSETRVVDWPTKFEEAENFIGILFLFPTSNEMTVRPVSRTQKIADDHRFGLKYKMKNISQSAKAMLSFLQSMRCGDYNSLWRS